MRRHRVHIVRTDIGRLHDSSRRIPTRSCIGQWSPSWSRIPPTVEQLRREIGIGSGSAHVVDSKSSCRTRHEIRPRWKPIRDSTARGLSSGSSADARTAASGHGRDEDLPARLRLAGVTRVRRVLRAPVPHRSECCHRGQSTPDCTRVGGLVTARLHARLDRSGNHRTHGTGVEPASRCARKPSVGRKSRPTVVRFFLGGLSG